MQSRRVRYLSIVLCSLVAIIPRHHVAVADVDSPTSFTDNMSQLPLDGDGGKRGVKLFPRSAFSAAGDPISNIIFLDRCVGGCTVHSGGINDARTTTSTIPHGGDSASYTVSEFAYSDDDWNAVVACVKETYAPYNVMVTDVDPGPAVTQHKAIVAGTPDEIGEPGDVLGVAPGIGQGADCEPANNVVSFSFANAHPPSLIPLGLCATIAQESAHSFGLDHAFDCSDPMTYLPACGQQFFRNKEMDCGEYAARSCRCGGNAEDPHVRLLAIFGQGTPPPAPVVMVGFPTDGATVTNNFSVIVTNATDKRGIARLELWLNGYKWAEVPGRKPDQQEGTYTLVAPGNVPDGIIDIEVKAFDDLETSSSAKLTVTKGDACTSAATCLAGQSCDAGKCEWATPTGQLGDTCTYDQFCLNDATCQDDGTGVKSCSTSCFTTVATDCPANFSCVAADSNSNSGFCFAGTGGGGCCRVGTESNDPRQLAGQLGLGALVLGFVVLRRRRQRA